MTQQEAAAYAEKLRVIWGVTDSLWQMDDEFGECFEFKGDITPSIYMVYNEGFSVTCEMLHSTPQSQLGWLLCDCERGIIDDMALKAKYTDKVKEYADFATEWMPFFRRSCFLSGAPIEHTATEAMEWHLWLQEQMQGVTP